MDDREMVLQNYSFFGDHLFFFFFYLVCVTQSANYVDIGYRGNAVCGSCDYEQVFNDDKHLVRHTETTRSCAHLAGCVVLFACPPICGRQSNSVI